MELLVVKKDEEYGASTTYGVPTDAQFQALMSGTAAGAKDLLEGAIGAFEEGPLLNSQSGQGMSHLAGAYTAVNDKMYFVRGDGSSYEKYATIDIPSLKWTKETYCAPTVTTQFIGDDLSGSYSLNAPSSLTVGDEVWITISDHTEHPASNNKRHSFDYVVQTGDGIGDVLTALVASINLKTELNITASVLAGNVGIKLLKTVAGEYFDVVVGGFLKSADIVKDGDSNSTVGTTGCGTNAQVLELERKTWADKGRSDTYENVPGMWDKDSQVESGVNYDIFTLTWKNPKDKATFDTAEGVSQILKIAVAEGTAEVTDIEDLLDDIGTRY